MARKYASFHEDGEGRALIELARQYPPRDGLRELVTNGMDARNPDQVGNILVLVNPYENRLIVSDDGMGMDYNKLISLSGSIGFSEKAGKVDSRGEKGLGLLGFGSLGDVMHMISRPQGFSDTEFGYLRWNIDESKGKIPVDDKMISGGEVDSDFYGVFPHGTRVIVDRISPHIIEKVLTFSNLKDYLRLLYNPALMKDTVNIHLGRMDRRSGEMKTETLEQITYEKESSSELLDDVMGVKYKAKNEEGVMVDMIGDLEMALFIDPEGAYDKVAVYSKDVLVRESLATFEEFSRSPVWTSGKVSGYINDQFAKLLLGRAGLDRNSNVFKSWYNAVREIEESIRPVVEEKKRRGKKIKEESNIKKVYGALADSWKDLKITDSGSEFTRSKDGNEELVTGVEPTKERPKGPRKKRKKKVRKKKKSKTGGTFRLDNEGKIERVVQKSGVPIGFPQPIPFPPHEADLRWKVVDQLGPPSFFVNNIHKNYLERESQSKNPKSFQTYLVDIFTEGIVYYSIRKEEREGELVEEKSELVLKALQRAEHLKYLALKRLDIK
jgi:hypothetical protein